MTFQFAPARREQVSLLIMIAGASGSGKTFSALKLARGLADGDDNAIAVIDTEAGRAKHYAVTPGEKPSDKRFGFQHGDLQPPFTPEAYLEAIEAADRAGFKVIVIDSGSHEWEGEGGLHDEHLSAVEAAVAKSRAVAEEKGWRFDEAQAADRASIGAWKEPKRRHKRFVSRLLQCRAHLILCLRADEKMKIEKIKDERGREKTVIVQAKDMPPQQRWAPICEKRLPYEMTLSFVLTPERPGFPVPIKLQDQHRDAIPLDKPLSEASGRALAEWARGGNPSPGNPAAATSAASGAAQSGAADEPEEKSAAEWDIELAAAAKKGTAELQAVWSKMPKDAKDICKVALDTRHKPAAAAADQQVPA